MSPAPRFDTPKAALQAMVAAGATFTIRQRDDGLGASFTYKVQSGGDLETCRLILTTVKSKPPAFFAAFRAHVQDIAGRVE